MKTTTCHTVIAGSDPEFRKRIRSVLKMAENESTEFSIVASEARTIDQLEKELGSHTDIAFIDASFVIDESRRIAQAWKKLKTDCVFALLLSDRDAAGLKNVIYKMEKQKSLPLDVHVLKNNYPDELIMQIVMRIVEIGCVQKHNVLASQN